MKTLLIASAACAAFIAAPALAQEEGGMRQLGAHVHGEARLSVAVDPASGAALVELSGAAWNFYGFEHAPETEEQRATISAVRTALAADDIIAWPQRAGCALAEVSVGAALSGVDAGPEAEHDHGDHDHADHEHGDHGEGHDHEDHDHDHDHHDGDGHSADHDHGGDHAHDEDAHAEHGEDHAHDDHGDHDHGEGEHDHTDVTASWTYQCERPEAASRMDAAALFAALPRLETIEAEAFDGSRAAVRTLTPDDAVITLE